MDSRIDLPTLVSMGVRRRSILFTWRSRRHGSNRVGRLTFRAGISEQPKLWLECRAHCNQGIDGRVDLSARVAAAVDILEC